MVKRGSDGGQRGRADGDRPAAPDGAPAGSADKLAAYRAKRSAGRTPEPFQPGSDRPGLFVVQKHAARRLHYDFRLELDGVLVSWAVPKGPSPDPADKRLAMHVEDHPVEYADFEGIIPDGNYGAGAVIVWDRGLWVPLLDPRAGLEKGKLLFELNGYKLRGVWTLVRTTRAPKEWLLIKERDAWSGPEAAAAVRAESILSGLTLEELGSGSDRAADVRRLLAGSGARPGRVDPRTVKIMLAETAPGPFTDPAFLFELKYDGYRILAAKEGRDVRLFYRKGLDAEAIYPEIVRAVAALPVERAVLDGELVVLDDRGHPVFQNLQRRALLSDARAIRAASVELPATLFVFDLLGVDDLDARSLPLLARKEALARLVPRVGPVRFADHVLGAGEALFAEVDARGLEGVMAKRADAPYRAGRSPAWLKVRADRRGDFVIVGLRPPRGSRASFGSLHVASYEGGELRYAGRVGSGFTDAELIAIRARVEPDRRATPAVQGELPREPGQLWVEPRVVCEVRYKERTESGHLRHPVFLRIREGMSPAELAAAAPRAATDSPGREMEPGREPEPPVPRGDRREVPFTNRSKVFWPEEGFTKGDLIDYYRTVSPWLMPYLEDRPVVLTRFPDGIHGKSFFQKDAPDFAPGWVRTERMWSENAEREIDYFVCDDVASLLYLINLGTIPLHVWSSRVRTLQRPDWCILDLDPKGAPFSDVVKLARDAHALCDEMEIPSFVKTSGSTGLHVLVPLGASVTYEQSRGFAELLARVLAERNPEIATIARPLAARGGKVYLDFLQNGHGRLLVAPYAVRPLPGAPVSTPLEWREVGPKLDPARFTIRTLPERLAGKSGDPLRAVLRDAPSLARALERLATRLAGGA